MVEGLGDDRVLQQAITGTSWLDRDWVAHDADTALRKLLGAYLTVNGPAGAPAVRMPALPTPLDDVALQVDEEQLAIEAELLATVNREED